jgi:hypothetical protein
MPWKNFTISKETINEIGTRFVKIRIHVHDISKTFKAVGTSVIPK